MKVLCLIWLIATGLAIAKATEECQNMCEVTNFLDPDLKICDGIFFENSSGHDFFCNLIFFILVLTDVGSKCVFTETMPRCVIDSPLPNNIPACQDSSGQWRKCIVPTDAVINGVTTRKSGAFTDNGASYMGGTLVWISGARFAEESFSTQPTSSTNNVVYLTNDFSSYACEIFPDATTTTQISCYTP